MATTAEAARRLLVTKQRLAGDLPKRATKETVLAVLRDLAYVQWDPVTIVAPSHTVSLWSRVGAFKLADFEAMLWEDKSIFLHWTPIASVVLTEDYPFYHTLMKGYPDSLSKSWGNHIPRAKRFLSQHGSLKGRLLEDLESGPLRLDQFKDHVKTGRGADGWSSGSDVSTMLFHLHMMGEVMVVGHERNQNVWGLTGQFLPKRAKREELTVEEFERAAAQRAIRALGTATASDITYYFVRGRYRTLKRTLDGLEEESVIHRVSVEGQEREGRFVHDKDVGLLDSVSGKDWKPRTTLIAPFDNLIAGGRRTRKMFGFDYVHEQFLPKDKRKYGTWVLPILRGDRLIGRVDPRLDKEKERLVVNSVHAEPGAPGDKEVAEDIRESIGDLASFIGAREVEYSPRVPEPWRKVLHS